MGTRPEHQLDRVLPRFALQLLRSLLGPAFQVLDLAAHLEQLPFLFGVLQAMLVSDALLRVRDQVGALFCELPFDRQLEVLL